MANCKLCDSPWHTAFKCPYKQHRGFTKRSKPMKHESDKARTKRQQTALEWFEHNPPDKDGYWYCYISKHPLCPKKLTKETINLEHDLSKARRPDLRYNIKNIYPACDWDNEAKGSKSAEEYLSE